MKHLSLKEAQKLLKIYCEAWEEKKPELLGRIFSKDAIYIERYYSKRYFGLIEIEAYWLEKVVSSQDAVNVDVKHVHLAGNVIVAEWEADFVDLVQKQRKRIYEVAILEIDSDGKISALREFWDTCYLDRISPEE